ncbi:SsgA family sporulation/cell division regulator [Streptomyces eurythermus]|uniref:SsgA family sporulation/cell division regulator n=1 Tax=Streptomyces eurythermus TaxID=42237 RepID=UPI0036F66B31
MCTLPAYVRVPDEVPVVLSATLRGADDDPDAVLLSLSAPGARSVTWSLSRTLLADGLRRPTRLGAVTVRTRPVAHPRTVHITLRRDVAAASVALPLRDVERYLRDTAAPAAPGGPFPSPDTTPA